MWINETFFGAAFSQNCHFRIEDRDWFHPWPWPKNKSWKLLRQERSYSYNIFVLILSLKPIDFVKLFLANGKSLITWYWSDLKTMRDIILITRLLKSLLLGQVSCRSREYSRCHIAAFAADWAPSEQTSCPGEGTCDFFPTSLKSLWRPTPLGSDQNSSVSTQRGNKGA